jgi:acyl-CoA thioester hydrolase
MADFKFYTEGRVRFCETDLQGILHHSDYLRYFEVGRVEYIRKLGLIENNDFAGPATITIVEASTRYIKPLKFDDRFKIYVRISEMKGATMTFEYKLVKTETDETVATGITRMATVDRKSFKPVRIPEIWHNKITLFEK